MKKHAKRAFGIFHDGLMVRMVELYREGTQVYLQSLDQTELDRYWYKINEDPAVSVVDAKTKEDLSPLKNDMQIDDFDSDYVTNYQLQPSDRMLASFNLAHGVIALNVYDENIVKDSMGAVTKKEMSLFVKSKVSPKFFKSGEWQSAIVNIGGQQQHWLHQGTNRLFELLQDHQRQNRFNFYFQLADANDIVLTDYFKLTYADRLEKETLLVYLGQEYRKAFVFREGKWVDTLKLQITQDNPELEVISSKLSLAIDSAQLNEPTAIIFCGDLVNTELILHIRSQFLNAQIDAIVFSNLIVATEDADSFDLRRLSQFTIPIALAYKALFADDHQHFTNSNFLPSGVIEGQKEFKVAWHGLIVLIMIFGVTLWGTFATLKANQSYRQGKIIKRELDATLTQKKLEATEIQKIRQDLENQEKNITIMKTLLEGKNPWTEILTAGNRIFAGQPVSWLIDLKRDKAAFVINGVTTRRANVISFADTFTNSQIRKVVAGKIRGKTIWTFEISADLPKIDWIGEIEQDIEALRAMKQNYGIEPTEAKPIKTNKNDANTRVVPLSPRRSSTAVKTDKRGRVILPPLQQAFCPIPREQLMAGDGADVQDYHAFVLSVNKGNIWEYRDLGVKYLSKYPQSELSSAVRWWLAYRLYLDKDNALATSYLDPMTRSSDRYTPYVILLQARIDYANGKPGYAGFYDQLQYDYSGHQVMEQAKLDLALITAGGTK